VMATIPAQNIAVKEALAETPMPEAGEGLTVTAGREEADITLLIDGTAKAIGPLEDPYSLKHGPEVQSRASRFSKPKERRIPF
ncbi:MAG: hypothetical protein AAF202_02905, partial [Pseudomonadota bacterium]